MRHEANCTSLAQASFAEAHMNALLLSHKNAIADENEIKLMSQWGRFENNECELRSNER